MNQKSDHLNCEFTIGWSIVLIFISYNKTNKPNELFIHNEFLYGRKLDPKKYYLEIDVLMLNNLSLKPNVIQCNIHCEKC
nr:hypothetical protein [Mycoplasmopsis bovis]